MNEEERAARETHAATLKRIRVEFQAKYPHYTPPPDASAFWWGAWVSANLKLHGADGFRKRFPKQTEIVEGPEGMSESVVAKLHAIAYGDR